MNGWLNHKVNCLLTPIIPDFNMFYCTGAVLVYSVSDFGVQKDACWLDHFQFTFWLRLVPVFRSVFSFNTLSVTRSACLGFTLPHKPSQLFHSLVNAVEDKCSTSKLPLGRAKAGVRVDIIPPDGSRVMK